jgi:hypothetical protein
MTKARDLANAGTALAAVDATELGYLDGVTSAVQTQIDAKQAVVSGVNDTEIGYLDGVTSAIQTQIDSRINSTIVDAKGDIVAATAADTVARLAVGANDTVLTADSSTATGLKWATPAAGGMTLISTTNLSGTSVTLSSLPTNYTHLYLEVINPFVAGGSGFDFYINTNAQFNRSGLYYRFFNGVIQANWNAESAGTLPCTPDGAWSNTYQLGTNSGITLLIESYNQATPNFLLKTQYRNTSGYPVTGFTNAAFNYSYTSAVTSIRFNSGLTFTGGQIKLWGVK